MMMMTGRKIAIRAMLQKGRRKKRVMMRTITVVG